MRTTPKNDKHQHPHRADRGTGRIRVTRAISRCRRIPGWNDPDPLTLPFCLRPGTLQAARARAEIAGSRWRESTWGTWPTSPEAEQEAEDRAATYSRALDTVKRIEDAQWEAR